MKNENKKVRSKLNLAIQQGDQRDLQPQPQDEHVVSDGVHLDQGVEQDWVNQYLVLYQHAVLNESESSDVVILTAAILLDF